jgi:TRAP-type C4-dicarboxylate transport system permease small subunit
MQSAGTSVLRAIGRIVVRFFDIVYKISGVLARILLVAMVLIIAVNVFMRYVLNSGIRWGEEIALVLVGWFVFLAIPMGVRKKLHISLHLWRRPIPVLDTILRKIAAIGIIGVGVVLLIYGNQLTAVAMRSIMPASKLPSGILYMILPLASVLMIYEALTDLIGYETDTEPSEEEVEIQAAGGITEQPPDDSGARDEDEEDSHA